MIKSATEIQFFGFLATVYTLGNGIGYSSIFLHLLLSICSFEVEALRARNAKCFSSSGIFIYTVACLRTLINFGANIKFFYVKKEYAVPVRPALAVLPTL